MTAGEALSPNAALLRIAISAAVPLWIEELRYVPEEARLRLARECGQVVAEKGDIIQFKSKKKGETAWAFNMLAKGLACLAFAPGGVRFLGLHFEARPTGSLAIKEDDAPAQASRRAAAKVPDERRTLRRRFSLRAPGGEDPSGGAR